MLTQARLKDLWLLWNESSKVERFGQFVVNRVSDDISWVFYYNNEHRTYKELIEYIYHKGT